MRRHLLLTLLAPTLVIGTACASAPAVTPTAAPATSVPAAATAAATATSVPPTATTAPPTATAIPPTPTAAATPTSVPTATATQSAVPAAAEADNDSGGLAVEGTPAARATSAPRGSGQSAAEAGLDVPAMVAAFANIRSFRAEMTSGEGDEELNGSMEAVLPDRFHIVLEGAAGQEDFDMISIGEDTYLRSEGGWEKLPTGEGSVGFSQTTFDELTDQLSDPSSTVTKGGTATVRGEVCQEWDVVVDGEQKMLCVSDDNLVRRMYGGGLTAEIFDYNADIQIVAPID